MNKIAIFGNGLSRLPLYNPIAKVIDDDILKLPSGSPLLTKKERSKLLTKALKELFKQLNKIMRTHKIEFHDTRFPLEYICLAILGGKGYYKGFITTNYDGFLQKAGNHCPLLPPNHRFAVNPILAPIEDAADYANFLTKKTDGNIPIWKIHGDINTHRWTCCDMLTKSDGKNINFKFTNHDACCGYGKGYKVYHILLESIINNDIIFRELIFKSITYLNSFQDKTQIDILGYKGGQQELFSRCIIDLLSKNVKTGKFHVNYINKSLKTYIGIQLDNLEKKGLHVKMFRKDALTWLRKILKDEKLLNYISTYGR